MMKTEAKSSQMYVKGVSIRVYSEDDYQNGYISITDIAKYKSDDANNTIRNWMRNRETIEFLGLWEKLHNPDFKPVEFDGFRQSAGLNAFTMSAKKWVKAVCAKGIYVSSGRYGGTYAHSDIAMGFASWISMEFKLYILKDYQRLKIREGKMVNSSWNLKREIARINYQIHTDAINRYLIPPELTKDQIKCIYADEADMLNVVLFGLTASQWKTKNIHLKGNMRDYASIQQLLVLSNMESYNAILIQQGKTQEERMMLLRELMIQQMFVLENIGNQSLLEK